MAAPVRKTLGREAWEARALELAETKHTIGTPRYLHECEYEYVWCAPPQSSMGSYDVLARQNGRLECPCQAGVWGGPCSHAAVQARCSMLSSSAKRHNTRRAGLLIRARSGGCAVEGTTADRPCSARAGCVPLEECTARRLSVKGAVSC